MYLMLIFYPIPDNPHPPSPFDQVWSFGIPPPQDMWMNMCLLDNFSENDKNKIQNLFSFGGCL